MSFSHQFLVSVTLSLKRRDRIGGCGHTVVRWVFIATLLISSASIARADDNLPHYPKVISREGLQAFADGYFTRALANSHTSGTVFVFVSNGNILLEKGYGLADRDAATPVDPARTVWRLASVSKSFTAIGILQLVQQGRVSLDNDVNTYLHDFKVPDGFGTPITVRELLKHLSGLDDRLIGDGFLSGSQPPLSQVIADRLPRRIQSPGTGFYSNYNYGLLGAVIEQVSRMPFQQYARRYILAPLGMNHSTFVQPVPPELIADLATPYSFSRGRFQKWPVIYHKAVSGGGMSATGEDMAWYILANLQDGELNGSQILSPDWMERAHGLSGLSKQKNLRCSPRMTHLCLLKVTLSRIAT